MSSFKRATRTKVKARIALSGPSGSGKTFTSFTIAAGLVPGGRIAVIDTENGSAEKSCPPGIEFDVCPLGKFDPRNYIDKIQEAENEGFDVIIIDSLSHAWFGVGGELDLVDQITRKSQSKNSYIAWKDVTPLHNALIQAIVGSRCHIIGTLRTKIEHVEEPNSITGKTGYRKVGTTTIQREGMDYEFDIMGEMDLDHNMIVSKARAIYSALDGQVINKPGTKLGREIAAMANDGIDAPSGIATHAAGRLDPRTVAEIESLATQAGYSAQAFLSALAKRGVTKTFQLDQSAADEILAKLRDKVASLAPLASPTVATHAGEPTEWQEPVAADAESTSVISEELQAFGDRLDHDHAEHASAGKAYHATV